MLMWPGDTDHITTSCAEGLGNPGLTRYPQYTIMVWNEYFTYLYLNETMLEVHVHILRLEDIKRGPEAFFFIRKLSSRETGT